MRRGWLSQMENNFKLKSSQRTKQVQVRSRQGDKGEKGEGKSAAESCGEGSESLGKEEKGDMMGSDLKRDWKEEREGKRGDQEGLRKEEKEDSNPQPDARAQDKSTPQSSSPPPPSTEDDPSASSLSSSMSLISLIYQKESKRNQFLMNNLSTSNVLVAGPGAPAGHIPRELNVPMPESLNINRKSTGALPFLFANQPQSYLSYPKKIRPEVPWDSSPVAKSQRHQRHGEDGTQGGMRRSGNWSLRDLMRSYVRDSNSSVASEMLPSIPTRHKNENNEEENVLEDILSEKREIEKESESEKLISSHGEWRDLWLHKMKELQRIQHEIHHTDLMELNLISLGSPGIPPPSARGGTNGGRQVSAPLGAVTHIFEYLYCLIVGNPSPGYLLNFPNLRPSSSLQLTSCSPTQTPRKKSSQHAVRSPKGISSPERGKEEKEARKLLLKESHSLLAFLQQVSFISLSPILNPPSFNTTG